MGSRNQPIIGNDWEHYKGSLAGEKRSSDIDDQSGIDLSNSYLLVSMWAYNPPDLSIRQPRTERGLIN